MKKSILFLYSIIIVLLCSQHLAAQIGTVHFRMPDSLGKRGQTYSYPVYCDDQLSTGDSVLSGEFSFASNNIIDLIGFDTVGTMLGGVQSVLYNNTLKKIIFANSQPVTGKGVLIYLKVYVSVAAPPSLTEAIILNGTMLNEGTPSVTMDNGTFRAMDIFIAPKNPPQNKVVGDSIQFSVTGDVTQPLFWTVGDTAVASIGPSGKLFGKKVGQTFAMITDGFGLQDQSGLFQINSPALNALAVTIRDTSFMQNLTFDLPIRISDVTSLGIISAQWKLNFNQNTLVPKAVLTAGTLAQAWGTPTVNFGASSIDVAMAGSDTLTGQGIIAYVRFQVKRFATQNSNLTLQNVLFNENISATIKNGLFNPIAGPVITINPNLQVLTKGDTITYHATGGTAPYKWTSSDTLIAVVDSLQGKVKVKARGSFTLTAFDAQGFDGYFSISVNDFMASLPDTTVRVGDSVDVPILVSDVTGLGILSTQMKIGYDTSKVRFSQLINAGTISGSMTAAVKDSASVVRIALSGAVPVSGSGIFAKLRFHHKAPAGTGQFTTLNFLEYQNNEASPIQPTTTLRNGKITIAPALNKNPQFIKLMNDTTIFENQQLTFDYDAFDQDNDQLKFYLQNPSPGMSIDSMNGLFAWKPSFTQSGGHTVTIVVADGKGGSALKVTSITVNNQNRSPVFTKAMNDTLINEDQQLAFDYDGTDPDNDQVKFFMQNGSAGMVLDSVTGVFTWKPTFTQSGNHAFTVMIADGNGGTSLKPTNISVSNLNRFPQFTRTLNDTTIQEQQSISFDIDAFDPDGGTVKYFLMNASAGMKIDSLSGLFTWTPTFVQSGSHAVTMRATDASGGFTDDQVTLTVLNKNQAPFFTKTMGDTTISEDQQLTFDYDAVDPDNNPITFTLQNGPAGMTLDTVSGVLNWRPTFSQSGIANITVGAKDPSGGTIFKQTSISVSNVNRIPFFTQVIAETTYTGPGQATNFSFGGQDQDNDQLTFSGTEMPAGASINTTGQFSWTPTIGQLGTHRMIIKLSDNSASSTDTSYFVVTINNTAPVFISVMNDTTISEMQPLTFTYKAFDNENDSLTFSLAQQSPAGLSISKNGVLNWVPDYSQAGNYNVVVQLTERQFILKDTVKITVLNINRTPQFISVLPDLFTFVDSIVAFKYTAVDPDNDALTFIKVKSPAGAVLQSDGVFNWKPVAADLGKDTFIVRVTDGTISVTDTAVVTVGGFPFAEVLQTNFDFGSITFGGTKTLKAVIKNKGVVPLSFRAPVQFNLFPPDLNFALDTAGTSVIPPGGADTISFMYSPKSVGGHSTGYVFLTNDFRNPFYTFTVNGSSIATLVVKKKMLVDIQHNSTAPLTDSIKGLGALFAFLAKSGIQVAYSGAVLQPYGNDVLLLVTPQKNYSKPEIDSISAFVKKGGLLIALGNSVQEGNNDALNTILKDTAWTTGLSLNNDIVVDSSSSYFSPFAPLVTTFADREHPYLSNVDTMVFFGSCSITVTGSAIPFATTSAKGRTIGLSNATQPVLVGLSKIGKGKIIVTGDADAWRVDTKSDSIPPNITIKDNLAFVLNILSITEDYQVKMPAKTPNEQYRLVSIPYDLEDGEIKSVLKGLGEPNPLIWRLFGRYDPLTSKYLEFPSDKFNSFKRGEAYWLITRGEFDLTPGTATIVPVQNFYPIKIGPGYSIVGNPFPFKVSWKNSIHDSVQNVIWGFEGTFKAESLSMAPFSGYFVKNLSKDSVTIYINPQDITNLPKSGLGKNVSMAASLSEGEWRVGISAVSGKSGDVDNFAGVSPGAKEEYDGKDISEPPPTPTDYVIVRFPNKQWKEQPGSYAVDIRSANDEGLFWDFEVITARAQSKVDLALNMFGELPNDFSLYLIDKASERAIPLNGEYQYQFSMMKNETRRNFRLIAGKASYVEQNTQGIPLVAMEYELMQNYPNPFNPSTQIRYVLGHSGLVTLEIYNVLGQRVRSLRHEFQPIGTYTVEWDGRNETGMLLATGVYFYRVNVTSNNETVFNKTSRMVLMK